ncbi:hypothetical protein [Pseudoalteromonas luteoviolacea]|uniref:Uncharacterized protein n=1 Tax=Pseudoalteromonas luteoviolacea S4060-1 TaxID=1365257 RepID=A0A162BWP3_9GAMM|nr:hypothetical protein [Pseudoalteromonas luteoviolacea]KZN39267.1 hypothetical protein N480_00130 [Pseudoalteromonas luteoviolacea S2607]KZN70356.1 hypothetical protein N478_00200 [Pseudoalteromonas luteoviolacea S4060-1]
MKNMTLVLVALSTFLSTSALAGTVTGDQCWTEDNSVKFRAKASFWDRIAENKLYISVTTDHNRTYTVTRPLTNTQSVFMDNYFTSMFQQSGYPNAQPVSYRIYDAFGSVDKSGSCI